MNQIKMSNLDKCLTYPAGVPMPPKKMICLPAAKRPKMDMDKGI